MAVGVDVAQAALARCHGPGRIALKGTETCRFAITSVRRLFLYFNLHERQDVFHKRSTSTGVGMLRIKGGTVYDPAHNINGVVKDLCIDNGKIVADNDGGRILDATGMIVFPGGVDIHTHVAGAALNFARAMTPENQRAAQKFMDQFSKFVGSNCEGLLAILWRSPTQTVFPDEAERIAKPALQRCR